MHLYHYDMLCEQGMAHCEDGCAECSRKCKINMREDMDYLINGVSTRSKLWNSMLDIVRRFDYVFITHLKQEYLDGKRNHVQHKLSCWCRNEAQPKLRVDIDLQFRTHTNTGNIIICYEEAL